MDAAERRAKRAKELAEKKKKLELLRRKRRERESKAPSTSSPAVPLPQQKQAAQATPKESIDDLVDNILSTPPPPSVLLHTKTDEKAQKPSAKRSILSESVTNEATKEDGTPRSAERTEESGGAIAHGRRNVTLTQQSFQVLSIPSKRDTVSYSKGVQTQYTGDDLVVKPRDGDSESTRSPNASPPHLPPPKLSTAESMASIDLDVDGEGKDDPSKEEMTEEEKGTILSSASFKEFFKRTSAICERALADTFDPTVSYGASATEENIEDTRGCLVLSHTFYDEMYSSNRAISSIDWNPHYKELFLTSMVPLSGSGVGNSTTPRLGQQALTPNGIVLVWSLRRPKTPEYTFTTQSSVTSALFDKFSTNFILGATYSGQIVLWDMRASNRPVQRSPLSADCHTHPVFNANIVGTTNNHEVVTVSTDGRMCTWNLGQLDQPVETTTLKDGKKDIAVTNMVFPPSGDYNTFLCGSEDGCVYSSQVHSSKSQGGTKKFEGHFGPITGMDIKASTDGKGADRLLTSSMDWTVKLWSHKPGDARHPLKCEQTFSGSRDAIYDAKWCPSDTTNGGEGQRGADTSNSVFATIGGEGKLALWDLEREADTSISEVNIGEALNKCMWSWSGEHIAVGSVSGKTYVYRNTLRSSAAD